MGGFGIHRQSGKIFAARSKKSRDSGKLTLVDVAINREGFILWAHNEPDDVQIIFTETRRPDLYDISRRSLLFF
jgi:hypothetical protein